MLIDHVDQKLSCFLRLIFVTHRRESDALSVKAESRPDLNLAADCPDIRIGSLLIQVLPAIRSPTDVVFFLLQQRTNTSLFLRDGFWCLLLFALGLGLEEFHFDHLQNRPVGNRRIEEQFTSIRR